MKELESETGEFKKLLEEAMLAKTMISERGPCELMGLSRTVLHYERCADEANQEWRSRIKELAAERRALWVSEQSCVAEAFNGKFRDEC